MAKNDSQEKSVAESSLTPEQQKQKEFNKCMDKQKRKNLLAYWHLMRKQPKEFRL